MVENNKSITYTVKIELDDIESDVIDKIAEAVAKKLRPYYPQPAPGRFWPVPYSPQRYWWQTMTTSTLPADVMQDWNSDEDKKAWDDK